MPVFVQRRIKTIVFKRKNPKMFEESNLLATMDMLELGSCNESQEDPKGPVLHTRIRSTYVAVAVAVDW